jgi:hypothetical protein
MKISLIDESIHLKGTINEVFGTRVFEQLQVQLDVVIYLN